MRGRNTVWEGADLGSNTGSTTRDLGTLMNPFASLELTCLSCEMDVPVRPGEECCYKQQTQTDKAIQLPEDSVATGESPFLGYRASLGLHSDYSVLQQQ